MTTKTLHIARRSIGAGRRPLGAWPVRAALSALARRSDRTGRRHLGATASTTLLPRWAATAAAVAVAVACSISPMPAAAHAAARHVYVAHIAVVHRPAPARSATTSTTTTTTTATTSAPATGTGTSTPATAPAPAPAAYIPDDPGNSGIAGGWKRMQWNFAGPFGVHAPEAWANLRADGRPGGQGVIVAVVDTGVAYANDGRFRRSPDFQPGQFVKGYDFIDHSPRPNDLNGHGTFVAGTIAEATNNGIGLTGLAYGVRIMPVRVLDAQGEGDASTIAQGVRYAVNHGAQVINLSLEFLRGVTASDIPGLISALAYAHRHGVVLVAAAGNEGSNDVPYPARDPYVISVGATSEHGCLASYTNYGRHVDIVAPGGGRDMRLPGDPRCHHHAPARDVFQETYLGTSPGAFGLPGGYEGTSMAAPEVSAAAALVIASGVLGPHPTPAAVRYRLEQTATPLGDRADAHYYGHGLLNAAAATAPGGPGTGQPTSQPSGSTPAASITAGATVRRRSHIAARRHRRHRGHASAGGTRASTG